MVWETSWTPLELYKQLFLFQASAVTKMPPGWVDRSGSPILPVLPLCIKQAVGKAEATSPLYLQQASRANPSFPEHLFQVVIPLPQCCLSFLLQLQKASLGPQQSSSAPYFSAHHKHQAPPSWKLPECKYQHREASQKGLISINNPGKWTSLICKMSVLANNKEYFPTKPFSCRRSEEIVDLRVLMHLLQRKKLRDNMGIKWSEELDPVKCRSKLICHGLHKARLL